MSGLSVNSLLIVGGMFVETWDEFITPLIGWNGRRMGCPLYNIRDC